MLCKPVDGFHRDAKRCIKTKGHISPHNIIINGLGQGDHIQAILGEPEGILEGAPAAQANQCIQVVFIVILHNHIGHIHTFPAHGHFMGLVAAGPQNGPSQGQDPRQHLVVQPDRAVFHQPPESIPESDDGHGTISWRLSCRSPGWLHSIPGYPRLMLGHRYAPNV